MIRLKMFRRHGPFFPNEICSLPPDVAERLILERKAKRVLEDESLEAWPEAEKVTTAVDGEATSEPNGDVEAYKFDPTTDPFVMDGLDDHTAKALHTNGIHTPGDVEAYLVAGKDLEDLDDIGKARVKKILELYGE